MRNKPGTSPRNEYLLQENQRVNESPLLTDKFPNLKSIALDLNYSDSGSTDRSSHIKYTYNLKTARSVFRVSCQNPECVRGDFDLSDVLDEALSKKSKSITNELCCQGWRSQSTIDSVPCAKILRYTLTLGY